MYFLETPELKINLDIEVFESDLRFPINTTVSIELKSFAFSCFAQMDVSAKNLAVFADRLRSIYESLEGTATLKEPYRYESFIEFSALKRGYILVSGKLYAQPNCFSHSISFENYIDQTDLKDFAEKLYDDTKKYL